MAPTISAPTSSLSAEFGGGRLLVSDIRTGFILVNAVRRKIVDRMFGVTEDQRNLLTLIIILMLADAVQDSSYRIVHDPPLPGFGDWILGEGMLQDALCSIAGPASRETPVLGTLLTLAVVAGAARPALVKAVKVVRESSHQTSMHFHHRYGYLVDPGHWRERHAHWRTAREARTASLARQP